MSVVAILERAQRRFRIVRSHFGFRFFIGWVFFGAAFVVATYLAPRQLVDEHKLLLAVLLALTGVIALFLLAYALIAALMQERRGKIDAT
jgi:hypothetical protein